MKNHRILQKRLAIAVTFAFYALLYGCNKVEKEPDSPEYVMEVLGNRINTIEDVQTYERLFTPKGRELIEWILVSFEEEDPVQWSISAPIYEGSRCYIYTTSYDSKFCFLFIRGKRWQFDDVKLLRVKGKDVNLWASYIKDHPIKTFFKLNRETILECVGLFLKGVSIGLSK